jgi:pyruvate kinase
MTKTFDRTKIIATLGPASRDYKSLKSLVNYGADVFRLNFSHGEHADKIETLEHIRKIRKTTDNNIGVFGDLQGPKIRLGIMEDGQFEVRKGQEITITTKKIEGNHAIIPIVFDRFPKEVKKGDKILIDDGKLELKILETDNHKNVKARILNDGIIASRKGVNLPDSHLSLPSVTKKDIEDLKFIVEQKLDWVALSFVRSAKDVLELKKLIKKFSKEVNEYHRIKVIAKIEKPQAVANIDEIIDVADAIMIARGDLGVEMSLQEIPLIQKSVVIKCLKKAKPVIIATQMMESMIENTNPTRAEVTDVANAIIDGADAVMLSGETAVGKNPSKVIEVMKKIIQRIEQDPMIYNKHFQANPDSETFISDAVCYNAVQLAQSVGAHGIIGMTRSGYTAFMSSSSRPRAKIFVFTDNERLLNRLSLVWGVKTIYYNNMASTDQTISEVQNILKTKGYLKKGEIVVNMASMPINQQGRTNMVKVTLLK